MKNLGYPVMCCLLFQHPVQVAQTRGHQDNIFENIEVPKTEKVIRTTVLKRD